MMLALPNLEIIQGIFINSEDPRWFVNYSRNRSFNFRFKYQRKF